MLEFLLRKVGEPLSYGEDCVSIGDTTFCHHITSILGKLGVSDRLERLIFAYKNNLAIMKT